MTRRLTARAKVNLALHVTGRRADGYHVLDSLVAFADFGDVLSVEASERLSLDLEGPFSRGLEAGEDNLVLRAARLFPGARGARITLDKRLPVASGIGGGSADAAAALALLADAWGQPLPPPEAILALGADIPVCLDGRVLRMRGIGEDLSPVPGFPGFGAVLVNPGVSVSTPAVFKALATPTNPALPDLPDATGQSDWLDWLDQTRNDLQPAASALVPEIGDVLGVLEANGARIARMSGSGATCFGLFEAPAEAQAAAYGIAASHPAWWVQPVRLG
jgi:4-diphosphocytidyl-2-C-methyl-D-erythritol kinase